MDTVSEQWLDGKTIAGMIGLSASSIYKRIESGYYKQVRYQKGVLGGGSSGKVAQIALSCLPENLQLLYKASQAVRQASVEHPAEKVHEVTESERQVAVERLAVLKDWQKSQKQWSQLSKSDLLPAFLAKHDISRATLYKWAKDYKDSGINGLLPERKDEKRGSTKMSPEAYDYLLALYLSTKKRTSAYCYELLSIVAADEGWQVPSLRTVQRIIKEIPEAVKMAARETNKTVYDKCLPYTYRDISKVLSNQVWVGDHFRCDFFVKYNGKWVRPWLTAWLDMRSRKFVSWMLCVTPSTGTIISSFAKAALNPAIGLPLEIYIDNGRDYCSKEFAGTGHRTKKTSAAKDEMVSTILESLKVKVHFAIPENARAKVIEREFRTVAEEICKEFPTWCASKPGDRPEDLQKLLKKDMPCMNVTLDEARVIIKDWFCNVKNKRVTSGKGRKNEYPDQTFEKYRMPLRTASKETLELLLTRHSQPLVVRSSQVSFKGIGYYSQELVKRYGEKVYIRYNEDAMDTVSVWDLKDKFICEAVAPQVIPGVGADKELLAAEQKRKARARKELYGSELLKKAKTTKVYDVTKVIELYKKRAENLIEPQRPKVILPMAVGQIEQPQPVKQPNKYENVLKYLNK